MSIDIQIKYARLPHGLVYFYQHWIPEDSRALVVFVHGLGDHSGRYDKFIKRMVSEGLACAVYDQRGHGLSEGRRGHVDNFEQWVEDLASFVNFSLGRVPEGTPIFIVGHSLGALVGINYLLTHAQPVAGMVSIAAALAPRIRIPKWKREIGERLSRVMPKLAIANGVRREDLTRETSELSSLESDRLFHDRLTLSAGRAIESNLELVGGFPQRIHTPMLMVAGSEDRVCDTKATQWFADRLASVDKICRVYDGMYHDMLHDEGSEKVVDDITEWILSRATGAREIGEQFLLKRGEEIWQNVSRPL